MKSKNSNRIGVFVAAGLAVLLTSNAVAQDDIQQQFDDAIQAIEDDRLRTARRTLKDLLDRHPNLQRARLELARVNYLTYDYDEAERLAQQVLDDQNTPPTVQTTVLAFLAQIREDKKRVAKRHSFTPSIYAGLMYDSNVNFGPSSDIIELNGVPLVVTPASQETDDWAVVLNPGIAHTFNPNKTFAAGENTGFFVWQSQANAYYRRYFSEDDFNFGVLTLRTGPAWIVPGHWRFDVGLQGDQLWYDDRSLAWFTSLNPTLMWELGEDTELTLDGIVTQRHYWKDAEDGRDGWYSHAGLSVDQFFRNDAVTLSGGVGYTDFNADDNRYGYDGPDVWAGVAVNAWRNGSVFGRVRYKKLDYDGPDPQFGTRDDDEWRFTAGFQHDFRSGLMQNWSLLGNWTFTDNDSDVPIFDYDRHEVNLGLSRAF